MSAENSTAPVATDGQDPMAGEWAAAVAENKPGTEVASAVEHVAAHDHLAALGPRGVQRSRELAHCVVVDEGAHEGPVCQGVADRHRLVCGEEPSTHGFHVRAMEHDPTG